MRILVSSLAVLLGRARYDLMISQLSDGRTACNFGGTLH